MSGMGAHNSAAAMKDEWLTPPHILAACGSFDLDPCSPIDRPIDTAARHFTIEDDGLSQPWAGRVWCNPPYGAATVTWLARLAAHGDGIALVFARTETDAWMRQVWAKADAILFIAGRLNFHHVDGRRATANAGAPSALVAYGAANADSLKACGLPGAFVRLRGGLGGTRPACTLPEPAAQTMAVIPTFGSDASDRARSRPRTQWELDLLVLDRIAQQHDCFFDAMGELHARRHP